MIIVGEKMVARQYSVCDGEGGHNMRYFKTCCFVCLIKLFSMKKIWIMSINQAHKCT